MNIGIVGTGALGSLILSFLVKDKNNRLFFIGKNLETIRYIKKNGIRIIGLKKQYVSPDEIDVVCNTKNTGKLDLVIVCVKSYDTAAAIRKTAPALAENTVILTLQNGLYNREIIKKSLPARFRKNVIAGVVSLGVTAVTPGVVKFAGKGGIIIGQDKKTTRLFNSAGLKTIVSNNIDSVIWSKLVVNSAVNPLGAILKVRNGKLPGSEYRGITLEKIVKESASVAKAKGIRFLYHDPVSQVNEVCRKTADNLNSMLQDVLNQRKTEIEFINGAIVKEGEKCGIATPFNRMLYNEIKKL